MSDNVMQDGDIIESCFAVERRNRTIHARMREYLYELKHREDLVTSIIPLGDGVAVSIKTRSRKMRDRSNLLIPASSLEVLKTAVIFGADAVYRRRSIWVACESKNFFMEEYSFSERG